jgi:uncharacterized membrane protein YheB (UPF0754 family)
VQELLNQIEPIFRNVWVQMGLLVLFATLHGYAGAWLAVRMLFRPRRPVKLLGITVFPQGMIPRHRAKLAAAIGKAVGEELVSSETIHEQLIGRDFLRKKIQSVVDHYTGELLSTQYPSLIEALPAAIREPVLDAVSGLQMRLAEHVEKILSSEGSRDAIKRFVESRVREILDKRLSELVDSDSEERFLAFIEERVSLAIEGKALEANIHDFVSHRIDELLASPLPVGSMFTADAVSLIKEKANEQIGPAIHQLTELAGAERTREQISALIKHEVHGYYENLSFFKKIFVSRENLLQEVDDLVNESFPRRIEETLRGTFFAEEAGKFISRAIDNALERPLPEILGRVDPAQLDRLKHQVSAAVISLLRKEETRAGINRYLRETFAKFRPHSVDAILQVLHPDAERRLTTMLTDGISGILSRPETTNMINDLMARQVEHLLSAPIGRLGDHVSEERVHSLSTALTDALISGTSAKLPDAIREFDVGGVVREKIETYPAEKLESLVLSVAKEHLRLIEVFGALFGLFIGIAQAVQFYFYSQK